MAKPSSRLGRVVAKSGISLIPKSFDNSIGWMKSTQDIEQHYYFKSASSRSCLALCGVVDSYVGLAKASNDERCIMCEATLTAAHIMSDTKSGGYSLI